jgi:hypothetical protein
LNSLRESFEVLSGENSNEDSKELIERELDGRHEAKRGPGLIVRVPGALLKQLRNRVVPDAMSDAAPTSYGKS